MSSSSLDARSATPRASEIAEAGSSSSQPTETCAQCNATQTTPLKQCNKCHSVSYCNKECQKSHYKLHKKECSKLAQAYVQANEPKMASRAPPRVNGRDTGYKKWQFDT